MKLIKEKVKMLLKLIVISKKITKIPSLVFMDPLIATR